MTTNRLQLSKDPKEPSRFTLEANQAMERELDFNNQNDFDDAQLNFLRTWDPVTVMSQDGKREVWSLKPYSDQTINAPCPPAVNPSLWRQSRLNNTNGLFSVTEGFYQVRAFDMSNMSIIEGKTGLIIIDPLISCECAADALKLYREYCESVGKDSKRPVAGVIFTHSHVDHFGGVLGVISPDDVKNGVPVIAPDGFLEHAVSENVYAGIAMSRRAQYMYGPYLKVDSHGQVDAGLGKGQSVGKISIVAPTISVSHTGQVVTVDGVDIVFHMTPGAEAPSEFDFYFPKARAFCAAENAVHTMHNIQTLRGARVRDALLWSKYLNETLNMFGRETDVLFASHHWPIWDKRADTTGNVARFLTMQRDMYRYLNDQTLRMLNKGYTGIEIAEVFKMPPALEKEWACRGYYGSVNHNVKAVYDRYMGWFDGNPSNLHPLPPQESSPKYVEAMGGRTKVLAKAEKAYLAGEYRWAAELLNKLIFAEPDFEPAKLLQADVLEQLGYRAEAATWRNFYLMGAQELRHGTPEPEMTTADPSMTQAMTLEMIFDAMAGHINGPRASIDEKPTVMNWIFTDTNEQYLVELSHGAMSTTANKVSAQDNVTIILTRQVLDELMSQLTTPNAAIANGEIKVYGDKLALFKLFACLDEGVPDFPIVTPRPNALLAWRGFEPKEKADVQEAGKKKLRILGKLPRGC